MTNYIAKIDNKIYTYNSSMNGLLDNIAQANYIDENKNYIDKTKFIIEETEEEIVQGYNTMNDGIYYIKGTEPCEPIDNLKQIKLQENQDLCTKFIYSVYPQYKQSNIAIYGIEEEKLKFKTFHDEQVILYDNFELRIKSCTSKEELDLIEIEYR